MEKQIKSLIVLLSIFVSVETLHGQELSKWARQRSKMVSTAIIGAGVKNIRVVNSMRTTLRHEFVPIPFRDHSYLDMSLPIGGKQTISAPFVVAYMTEALDPQPEDKVLEIGTGSGYQAAVLSPLVKSVYTIEIVQELAEQASSDLARLKYENVYPRHGDGFKGWPEHAPFDKIIVTCSPESVPKPLVEQLKEGGLIVIPVGERYQQTLYLLRKENGEMKSEALRPTLFVPMTGAAEDTRQVKPDPGNPAITNGNFEEQSAESKSRFVPGWYYQRQSRLIKSKSAPEGEHYLRIANNQPGKHAHLMQGFAIDGGVVSRISLTGQLKYYGLKPGRNSDERPAVVVAFYDSNRQPVGFAMLGPFQGTKDWHEESQDIQVPSIAREAIIRVGLFGGTGTMYVDDLRVTPID